MKGIILVNAYSDNADYLYQARRLAKEFSKFGVRAEIRKNYCGVASVAENGEIKLSETADFAVFLDKDKYVMNLMERAGIRLFNTARAIELCDDKMLTHIALVKKGIPMPETIPAPLCYTPSVSLAEDYCENVVSALGLPLVVKYSYGSLGKQVYLADTKERLCALATELRTTPHFYQRYIAESRGKDLRVIAIGGKPVAAMIRRSNGDFRSNVALGGDCEPYSVTEEVAKIVEKASAALQLDYCGVDLLFGKDGFLLCEVNSNAYFKGIEKATGVNVAAAYVEHILRVMQNS